MTFEEFLIESMNTPTEMRRGQFAVNLLAEKRRDLFDKMMKSYPEVDPFYQDVLIPKFLIWVGNNW